MTDMHAMFADWYSKADLEASREKLEARWAGIVGFVSAADLDALLAVVRFLRSEHGEAHTPATLQTKLKEHDPSFLLSGNQLELGVLGAIALMRAIDARSDVTTTIALAIQAASMLGTATLGPLSAELVDLANKVLHEKSRRLRAEHAGSEITPLKLPVLDSGAHKLPGAGDTFEESKANDESLSKYVVKLNARVKALAGPFRALMEVQEALVGARAFSRVLAEECSMLWWLFGAYGRDANEPLASIASPGVCLVVAKDLADLTNVVPGPISANAILHRALDSAGGDASQEFCAADLVNSADRSWRVMWLAHQDMGRLRGIAHCLPAVADSISVQEGGDWQTLEASGAMRDLKLSRLDWAQLCYVECLLLRQCGGGHG